VTICHKKEQNAQPEKANWSEQRCVIFRWKVTHLKLAEPPI